MGVRTVGGAALVLNQLPTFAIEDTNGDLGSGQDYIMRAPVDGPGWPPVLLLHGFSASETVIDNGLWPDRLATWLAAHGFTVISGDVGGTNTWGNAAFMSEMDELVTFARTLGLDDDQVGLIGVSMGASNALAWAADHFDDVLFCVGGTPTVDLEDIHTNNRSGLTSFINSAHGGGAGWTAAQPNVDPTARAGDLVGLPCHFTYGDADTIVIPQTVLDFAAAIGSASLVEVPGDHGPANIAADAYRTVSFIVEQYAPALALRTMVTA